MPRYFFDIDAGTEQRDAIGRELDGGENLRAEALRVAMTLIEVGADKSEETTVVISIRDESGAILSKVRLACQVDEL